MIIAGFDISKSRFLPYYYKVWKRQRVWRKKLKQLSHIDNSERCLQIANDLATSAVFTSNGYWSSGTLEQVYLDCAKQIPDVKCHPIEKNYLHVLTQCYCTGGHTRVVERWINSSPSDEVHSVILLNQEEEKVPDWLLKAVERHNGFFIQLNEPNQINRAAKLREVASHYSKVILHVHMNDGTPIIAFGVESFTSPVIFYNHADHVFWLGASIADIVADIRFNTKSTEYRNVNDATFVGIPPAINSCERKRDEFVRDDIKKELAIEDKFTIITTAGQSKLLPFESIDYVQFLLPLIQKNDNVIVLVIGAQKESKYWKNAFSQSKGRIVALGEIRDKDRYENLLQVADLYLGSLPFASFTAMKDAVEYGAPFLQMLVMRQKNTTWGISKNELNSDLWPQTPILLQQNLGKAIKDKIFYEKLQQESHDWLLEYNDFENWKKALKELYKRCPTKHRVYSVGENVVINDECVTNNILYGQGLVSFGNRFLRGLSSKWISHRLNK